jgi:hypothetical protein
MRNEYRVTKELMISWWREFHFFGINIFLTALFGVLGADCLILLGSYIITKDFGNVYFYLVAVILLLSVYKIFFSRYFVMKKRYQSFAKIYGVPEWTRVTEFSDNDILLVDCENGVEYSVARIKYENVKRIKEKGNAVFLYCGGTSAIRIYKDAFVNCTWEECRAFVEGKIKEN